jgi:hypothetical protein
MNEIVLYYWDIMPDGSLANSPYVWEFESTNDVYSTMETYRGAYAAHAYVGGVKSIHNFTNYGVLRLGPFSCDIPEV